MGTLPNALAGGAVGYLQPVRGVYMIRIRRPSGHWRAELDHAECTLPKSCEQGPY